MVEAIRLQAADEDDLVVLSTLLQDATVLIGDMAHDPEQDQFLMVAAQHAAADGGNRRHLTGINFSGVTHVRRRGFSPEDSDDVLNLLAITPYNDGIEVVFRCGNHQA